MSNATVADLNSVFDLLTDHNHELINSIPEDLKCGFCSGVLVKAYVTECECRFCKTCLDEILNKNLPCFGSNEKCRTNILSWNSLIKYDQEINNTVSQIEMKCLKTDCTYQCKIINMKEHLETCGYNRSNEVEYIENQHIRIENSSTTKDWLDVITYLITEMNILKKNQELCSKENKLLKQNQRRNEEKLLSMTEELKVMKAENEKIEQQMNNWQLLLQNKLDEVGHEMHSTIEELRQELEIQFIRKELDSIDSSINSMRGVVVKKEETNDKVVGIFVWHIENIMERRKKRGSLWSDYFHTRNNKYKMRLQLHPNGFVSSGTGMNIFLFLYPSESPNIHCWPFKADISIKITNNAYSDKWRIVRKSCSIDKPFNHSYKCCACFDFLYQDLQLDNLFHNDRFTIECFVSVK